MGLRREHPGGAGGVVCLKVHRLCLLCVVHEVNKPLSIARRVRSISRNQIEKSTVKRSFCTYPIEKLRMLRRFAHKKSFESDDPNASMTARSAALLLAIALCRSTLSLQPPTSSTSKTRVPAVRAIAPALPSGIANGRALRRALQIPAQSSGTSDVRAACTAAAAQALVLAGTADSVSQSMHGPVDVCHVASMALTAAALSGACNAAWLRKLEETWPGTGTRAVVSKSLADFCVCAPSVLSGYLVLVPLLTLLFGGASLDAVTPLSFGWTQEGFGYAMLLNLCVSAAHRPPAHRPDPCAMTNAPSAVFVCAAPHTHAQPLSLPPYDTPPSATTAPRCWCSFCRA